MSDDRDHPAEAPGVTEITPSRAVISVGWDDVPHLTKETKTELLRGTPPHLRDARSKGIPSMGAGAIYPIPWEEVIVNPFPIPAWWPRWYALDVGWRWTAAMWFAEDRETMTVYAYSEHKRAEAMPISHAEAIKARGAWMQGVIDPAARNRTPQDGSKLFATYVGHGLNLMPAVNAVEAGLLEVWMALEAGRLKFFSTLTKTEAEYRVYRRDERGHVVKDNDHLMDTLRYGIMAPQGVRTIMAMKTGTRQPHAVADSRAGY